MFYAFWRSLHANVVISPVYNLNSRNVGTFLNLNKMKTKKLDSHEHEPFT